MSGAERRQGLFVAVVAIGAAGAALMTTVAVTGTRTAG
jgi:hypothetical protein